MTNIFLFLNFPRRFQMSFQDSATPVMSGMSGIVDLHSCISFSLILILIFVAFQIFDVLIYFRVGCDYNISKKLFSFIYSLNQKVFYFFLFLKSFFLYLLFLLSFTV